jgi:hypothetical protein
MSESTQEQVYFSDAIALSDAFARHIETSFRYWIVAATVTFAAYTGRPDDNGEFKFLEFQLGELEFYQSAALLGSISNFAYCISHLQAYETSRTFKRLVNGRRGENDVHLLLPSALNRVFPIARAYERYARNLGVWLNQRRIFRRLASALVALGSGGITKMFRYLVKLPVDFFVVLVPASGFIGAIVFLPYAPVNIVLYWMAGISLLATGALALEALSSKWDAIKEDDGAR